MRRSKGGVGVRGHAKATVVALVGSMVAVAVPVVGASADSKAVAIKILENSKIELATSHSSGKGVGDGADAKSNVQDTSNGKAAKRSSYDGAPGGTVALKEAMLQGMLDAAGTYSFRVSEVAGGKHSSANSRHYKGTAFDVDRIDGKPVNASHPTYKSFMKKCKDLGATEALGPGDEGHDTHVHAAWTP